MYELTEAGRHRLAPQADGAGTMAPPEGLEAQLRTGALGSSAGCHRVAAVAASSPAPAPFRVCKMFHILISFFS
jgi:hypothetical protein